MKAKRFRFGNSERFLKRKNCVAEDYGFFILLKISRKNMSSHEGKGEEMVCQVMRKGVNTELFSLTI